MEKTLCVPGLMSEHRPHGREDVLSPRIEAFTGYDVICVRINPKIDV